ncbi:40S ribosomal protein S25 [Malassezia caprae]|uniref:40S ribosomal protein S25 n=1 Tax=Malassezia caprae TaxID=1381934 RepID=A0AAF0E6V1_9BASI|nr:40S ribosomal protein S25 [Malassezia caprae]
MAVLEEIGSDESLQGPVESGACTSGPTPMRFRGGPVAPDDPDGSSFDEWSLQDSDSDADDAPLGLGGESSAAELYQDLQDGKLSDRAELLFDLVLWCIPFGFLFELLNLLAQKQYHQESTVAGEVATLAQRLPHLNERRKWLTQMVMFVIGTFAGCYLAYMVNKASYDISLARTPALGTLWIYAIVRLELGYATASVLLFGAYMPPKKSAILASASKAGKKKKWSKGRVKDKAQNAVYLDKPLYEKVIKEVPTFKMITPSVLIDRLKINGSVARLAIRHFEREGQIKPLIHHHGQLVYSIALRGRVNDAAPSQMAL